MREVSNRGQTRLCGLDLEMTSSGTDVAHLAASNVYLRANVKSGVHSGKTHVASDEKDEPGQLSGLRPHMSEQASVSCRETARVNVGRMFACVESSSCPAQHPSDWQRIAPARAWPSAPAVG